MKFTCLKMVFPSLLKKLRKQPPPHTHPGCCLGLNEDTSSTRLKYYMQDKNYYASLYYITLFPLGNYIQFNRKQ